MKTALSFCSAAVLTVFVPSGFAQEDVDESPQNQKAVALTSALEKATSQVINGTVSISEEQANLDSKLGGMLGGVQVMGVDLNPGGTGIYSGDVDVQVNADAIVAVSKSGLPQIKIYREGAKRLISQTYSKNPKDLEMVSDLLANTLDFKALGDEIRRAKRVRSEEVDGGTKYRVTIDADYFDPSVEDEDVSQAGGMMGAMDVLSESVLEGVLIVHASSSGDVQSLELAVQYNDPMSGLLAGALGKGGGGGVVGMGPGDLKKSEDPGRKVTLKFTRSDVVSKAAQAFVEEANQLLK